MVTLKSENGKYIVTVNREKAYFESLSAAFKYIGACKVKENTRDE